MVSVSTSSRMPCANCTTGATRNSTGASTRGSRRLVVHPPLGERLRLGGRVSVRALRAVRQRARETDRVDAADRRPSRRELADRGPPRDRRRGPGPNLAPPSNPKSPQHAHRRAKQSGYSFGWISAMRRVTDRGRREPVLNIVGSPTVASDRTRQPPGLAEIEGGYVAALRTADGTPPRRLRNQSLRLCCLPRRSPAQLTRHRIASEATRWVGRSPTDSSNRAAIGSRKPARDRTHPRTITRTRTRDVGRHVRAWKVARSTQIDRTVESGVRSYHRHGGQPRPTP